MLNLHLIFLKPFCGKYKSIFTYLSLTGPMSKNVRGVVQYTHFGFIVLSIETIKDFYVLS